MDRKIKLDKFDINIINHLKTVDSDNLMGLTLKSGAREGQECFRQRIERLRVGCVVLVDKGRMGRSYTIKLTEGFK